MVPTGSLYHVIVNGMAYPTDLATLRQWVQQGRVRPETLVGKGTMKPIPAREVPALREAFAQVAPPTYAPPTPPSYAPPQPQNSGYSQPYVPPTPPPPSYAPPSGGYGQSYAPPSNPQLQNSGYAQPYAPPTPPSPPAYAPPQSQNSGYSQPYTTAPSLNAPTPPPRPAASGTMAPLQPFHRDYAASASSGYSQPYAQPVSAPVYGAVSPLLATGTFPNEFHKQDDRYIDAMTKIRTGWITGLVIASLTFLMVSVVVLSGKSFAGLSAFGYIDVLIGLGLSFGIYCKSRICAASMVIYYVLSKIVMMVLVSDSGPGATRGAGMIVVPIFITIALVQGAIGTFKYHELKAEAERGRF